MHTVPYPLAFALTLLVELPLYTVALTALGRVPARLALAAGTAANCATHPLLWWFLNRFAAAAPAAYWTAFALAEAVVCLVEAVLVRALVGPTRLAPVPALTTALTANAASVLAGLLLTAR
ncbi:hypothetical protein GCM10010441_22330 [Kitasatospora paracochleata]